MENPKIRITMSDGAAMTAELYPMIAPKTVENFIKLVKEGFYNGLTFHRIIEGFMIQGGCPDGTGMGGPGWSIPGEFSQNGFENSLLHQEGVLSMARTADPDSAGSQFFVMTDSAPHLDGAYAAFGKLTDGFEALHEIEKTPTPRSEMALGKSWAEIVDCEGKKVIVNPGNMDMPLKKAVIKKIEIVE